MNDRGEVLAMIGVRPDTLGSQHDGGEARSSVLPWARSAVALALPVAGFSEPTGEAQSFAQLAQTVFRKPVTRGALGGYIYLGKGLPRSAGGFGGFAPSHEFSKADGVMSAAIQWRSPTAQTSTISLAVYGRNERLVVRGAPSKVVLKPNQGVDSTFTLDLAAMEPSDYRLDVLWGDEVAARTYFRLKP